MVSVGGVRSSTELATISSLMPSRSIRKKSPLHTESFRPKGAFSVDRVRWSHLVRIGEARLPLIMDSQDEMIGIIAT